MKKMLICVLLCSACGSSKPQVETDKQPALVENTAPVVAETTEVAETPLDPEIQGDGYVIRYPGDWQLVPKFMGTDTMAISPKSDPADTFQESVNVVFEDMQQSMTPQAYQVANLPAMQSQLQKFTVVSEKTMQLPAGYNAIDMLYSHEFNGVPITVRAIFLTRGTLGYVITCSASPSSFADFADIFDDVVSSFEFR